MLPSQPTADVEAPRADAAHGVRGEMEHVREQMQGMSRKLDELKSLVVGLVVCVRESGIPMSVPPSPRPAEGRVSGPTAVGLATVFGGGHYSQQQQPQQLVLAPPPPPPPLTPPQQQQNQQHQTQQQQQHERGQEQSPQIQQQQQHQSPTSQNGGGRSGYFRAMPPHAQQQVTCVRGVFYTDHTAYLSLPAV